MGSVGNSSTFSLRDLRKGMLEIYISCVIRKNEVEEKAISEFEMKRRTKCDGILI